MTTTEKKNILVTGATGFIGRALCVKMLERQWSVKALLRRTSPVGLLPPAVQVANMDSMESGGYYKEDFEGIDTVVHLAGRVHVIKAHGLNELEEFRRVNVAGTAQLARVACEMGVRRFIFISSVKVNGEGADHPYTEADCPDPKDSYGISKREAENVLLQIAEETGLEIVILRFPLVYGPYVKANFESLIRIVKMGLPLPLKRVSNLRSFIFLENAVDAILTCIIHSKAAGETFLVSDGRDFSTVELLEMLARLMNKTIHLFFLDPAILKFLSRLIGREEMMRKLTNSLVVDSRKIRELLDWKPPYGAEEGLKMTVEAAG